jgi:hypothetical protein
MIARALDEPALEPRTLRGASPALNAWLDFIGAGNQGQCEAAGHEARREHGRRDGAGYSGSVGLVAGTGTDADPGPGKALPGPTDALAVVVGDWRPVGRFTGPGRRAREGPWLAPGSGRRCPRHSDDRRAESGARGGGVTAGRIGRIRRWSSGSSSTHAAHVTRVRTTRRCGPRGCPAPPGPDLWYPGIPERRGSRGQVVQGPARCSSRMRRISLRAAGPCSEP